MKTEAIVFEAPRQVAIRGITMRDVRDDEVLVKTSYSLISPGTELRILAGNEANARQFPLVPGYALAGRIVQAGRRVDLAEGTAVFVNHVGFFKPQFASSWGAHIGSLICPAASIIPLPPGVGDLEATFAAVLGIAYHGVNRVAPGPGERVVIVGQGLIGLLATLVFKMYGAKIVVADVCPERLTLARKLGAEEAIHAAEENLQERLGKIWENGADIAVEATGQAVLVGQACRLLKGKPWDDRSHPSGRLLLLASYPEPISLEYNTFLFDKEPDIYPSRSSLREDKEAVLRLLAAKKLEVKPLVSAIVPYVQAEEAYARLENKTSGVVTFAFQW